MFLKLIFDKECTLFFFFLYLFKSSTIASQSGKHANLLRGFNVFSEISKAFESTQAEKNDISRCCFISYSVNE